MDYNTKKTLIFEALCSYLVEFIMPENYNDGLVHSVIKTSLWKQSLDESYTPFFIKTLKNTNENSIFEIELYEALVEIVADLRKRLDEETDKNYKTLTNLEEIIGGAVVGTAMAIYKPLKTVYSYAKQYEEMQNKIGICRKLPTPEAILRCQMGAYTRGINELKATKSQCAKTRNAESCARRVDTTVAKMEKSMEQIREKLAQIAEERRQAQEEQNQQETSENKEFSLISTHKILSEILSEVQLTSPKPYIPKTDGEGNLQDDEEVDKNQPEERDDYKPSAFQRAKSGIQSTIGNIRDNPAYAAKTGARYVAATGAGVGGYMLASRAIGNVVNPTTEKIRKTIENATKIASNPNANAAQLSMVAKSLSNVKRISRAGALAAPGMIGGMVVGTIAARIAGKLADKTISVLSAKRIDHCDRTFSGSQRWVCRQKALDGSIAELKKMAAACGNDPKCVKIYNKRINQAIGQKKEAADNYRRDRLRGK